MSRVCGPSAVGYKSRNIALIVFIIGLSIVISMAILPSTSSADTEPNVTFDKNGGSIDIAGVYAETGDTITLPDYTGTKSGYEFSGWELNDTIYHAGDSYEKTAGDIIFVAHWTVGQYTISFDSDGGSAVSQITQDYGSDISAPSVPTKTGYSFVKWQLNGSDYEFGTMPAENITLTAVWSINQYTITFDSDGGSAVSQITQDYGSDVSAPSVPTKTGYSFVKWQLNGSDYEFTTMPAEDITLKAVWSINQYTITFDSDGGSSVIPIKQDYGTAVNAPADPSKMANEFVKWQLNGSDYEFTTMPAEDITLKAVWSINQYTITFDSDGGSTVSPITQEYGSDVTAPADPTKDEHVFDKWQLNGSDYEFTTMPAENITLTAVWMINRYTISFDTVGGSSIDSVTQDYGSAVSAPSSPTKTGHSFVKWQLNGVDYEFTTMPAENITLTAVWSINQYTITFDSDGGTSVASLTCDYGTVIESPAEPTKTGYTFMKWMDGTEKFIFVSMPARNVSLKAVWEINQYTITFDSNGGSAVGSIKQNYNTDVTKPTDPTRTEATFVKWQLNGVDYEFTTMPAEDITLTAVWDINEYTITFDTDGGNEIPSMTKEYGSDVSAPSDPTKEGYTFVKWLKGDDDYEFATMPAENITLTAVWSINQYTITFDSDGGNAVPSITDDFNAPISAPEAPERKGCSFVKWQENGADFTFNTIPARDVSLKAVWNRFEFTITFDSDGGSDVSPITERYGTAINEPAPPTRTGHDFIEWQLNGVGYTFETMPNENIELKAVWELKTVTISFDTDGGNTVEDITGKYGSYVSAPFEPKRTGYTFVEWQDSEGAEYVFSTMPAEDIVIKAVWEVNKYKLSFDSDGGNEIAPADYDYSAKITRPADPVKEGYTFIRWQLYGKEFTFDTMPAEDITVLAIWKINQYTISFDSNGGSSVPDISKNYNSSVTEPRAPTKEGHSFIMWVDSEGEKYTFSKMPSEDITLTAVWTINKYTIYFDADNGVDIGPITQDYDTPVTAPEDPVKEGNTFVGWSLNGIPYVFSNMPSEDIYLKAIWATEQYTITFDANGGKTSVQTITGSFGELINAPIPVLEGYTFVEWQYNGKYYDVSSIPGSDITVKAKWAVNQYIITFNSDGGSSVGYIKQDYGTKVTAPKVPTKHECTFISWQLDGKDYTFDTMPAKDIELKAKWAVNQYTVTFDTDGGTSIPQMICDFDSPISAPQPPTKEGYAFVKWELNGSTFVFTYMPAMDIELKAVWAINEYTVTFDTGSEADRWSVTVEYMTPVERPLSDPVLTGHTFMGWQLDGIDYDFSAAVVKDLTIKTKWTVNNYTITFDTDGGTKIDPITQTYGSKLNLPAASGKEGYSFVKWQIDGEDVDIRTMPAADLTLTAKWTAKQYRITYDTDGGSEIESSEEYYGSPIYAPVSPTMTGYSFVKWQDNGKDFTFDTMPARDLTLRSIWNVNQYRVTFVDESGAEISHVVQDYMSIVSAPNVTPKAGHSLSWQLNGEDYDFKVPAKNIKVNAVWTVLPFSIAFDTDGGTPVETITQYYNTEVTEPESPTKSGYTFDGWQLDGKDYVFTVMPAKNITLKAKWDVNKYVITFKFGDKYEDKRVEQAYGTDVTAPEIPDKEGYTFEGWSYNGRPYTVTKMPSESITVEAVWKINQYTISFDTDGGSEVAAIKQDYDSAVRQPDFPTKEGYSFTGWVDEFNDIYEFTKMPSRNVKLTAVWSINSYMVTFDTDGGSYVPYQTVRYGDPIQVPSDPTKSKYEFIKWQKDGKDYEFGTMPAEHITLKAIWGRVYTATFVNNGKTFHEDVLHNGDTIAYPGEPTKASTDMYDFRFISWSGYIENMKIYSDLSFEAQYQNILKKVDTDGEKVKVDAIDTNNVLIGSDSIDQIIASGSKGKDVMITLSNGSITLDSTSASSLPAGEKTITIANADRSKIKEDVRALIQDRPVYSISIGDIHEFAGTLTISLKYTPAENEDTEKLYIWYIKDDGTCEKVECTYFDGFVTFTTGHLSDYAVMLETSEPEPGPTPDDKPVKNPSSNSGINIGLIAGIAVAIIAIIAVALFVVKKKH